MNKPLPGTSCCLCPEPAVWLMYDDYGIPRNTYCDEHRPDAKEVPC